MTRDTAIKIQQSGRAATAMLIALLDQVRGDCSDGEFQSVKRGVGLTIGRIQMDLIEPVLVLYPDVDDLPKDRT